MIRLIVFLRITDILFERLIADFLAADSFSSKSRFDPKKQKCLSTMKQFLEEVCKINVSITNSDSLSTVLQSLNGEARQLIFENITKPEKNITILFGESVDKLHRDEASRTSLINKLWIDYYYIFRLLKQSQHPSPT